MGVVTEGIIAMPYELAMADELTRMQFYQTVTSEIATLRARLETVEADRAAQAERIRELENRLGCATHNAVVATIGHAQLNEYVAIFDGLGFRGIHVDEQVRRAAAELRALRADRAAQAERMARLEEALREWVEADDAWQGSFEDDVRIERAKDAARALSQEGSDA